MAPEADLPVEERILQLLQHLGIPQAHFAARNPADWQGLARAHPQAVGSLTLVCSTGMDPSALGSLAPRLLIFAGDRGGPAEAVKQAAASLSGVTLIILDNYASPQTNTDVLGDRTEEIGVPMLDFLARQGRRQEIPPASLLQKEGEVAGISYRVRGSGPPLVLLPLANAPSQWEPLLPRLSQLYCTITLGGAHLGFVAQMEARGRAPGYLGMVRSLVEEAELRPGEPVLDVGCGTGVLDRWLARRTSGANRIVGMDNSRYLLREATALARSEGLESVIEFQEGDAEALPLPDNSFDVTLSITVMAQGDADLMLAELVRVTRPEGRVAVIVLGDDRSLLVNLPLRAELKAKAELGAARNGPSTKGCADASLYRRFRQAGLSGVKMLPQLVTYYDGDSLQNAQRNIVSTLSPDELKEWRTAVAQAEAEGTFFIATTFHCAVGTKPV